MVTHTVLMQDYKENVVAKYDDDRECIMLINHLGDINKVITLNMQQAKELANFINQFFNRLYNPGADGGCIPPDVHSFGDLD